ncbi:ESF1 homolog [Centropristis striata]|uniref:ESF1 homolog n=1 Tax=Centropristis striata TaxID=184440 RepID=UPI0027E0E9EF|nr:ESF1 homolog [Centropristis striata]XP_059187063.1 ESF1 homolog [Centropristis striata]
MSSKKKQDGDERFSRVQKDPRFWEMPEKEHKIKIDKRFQSMFHDKRFKVKYTVDKRGRPIHQTSTEDLKRFYKVSDSEDSEDSDEDGKSKKKNKKVKEKKLVKAGGEVKKGKDVQSRDGKDKGEQLERGVRVIEEDDEDDDEQQTAEADVDLRDSVTDGSEEEDDDEDDDDDDEDEDVEEGSDVGSGSDESGLDSDEDSDSGPDLARGKGNIETSSDEDSDDDVDRILKKEEEEIEHAWGELAKDAQRSDEVSARLAVCNMDWDRMKAKDLLALFNSFVPKGGAVLSVKIYPSEFGKERLQVEETQGPPELRALPDDSEDDTEEEKGYREKMRDYQFKRLKYFYAVAECDSADTAAKIYQECDGYEYESSCSVLDLRFIPDEVQFDEEPKDAATDVNLTTYTPKLFTSSANATSKVQLTWDETDNERVTALNRKFNKDELLAMDFNAYLASSSEEEEEEEEEEEGGIEFGDDDTAAEDKQTEESVVEMEKKPQKEKEKKKNSKEQISKYRELLKGIQDKEKKLQEDKDMEMEITWVPGLRETTEQLVQKKLEGKDTLTPWEEFLEKKKDRKKQKKSQRKEGEVDEDEFSDDELPADVDLSDPFFAEELSATDKKKKQKGKKKKKQEEEERTAEEEEELEKQKAEMALLMEDDDDKHKHFNYDKIVEQQNLSKKKRKKLLKKGEAPMEGDDFQVDVKDPRFQAMFTSHLFNLDPSHPNYKKTKATQSILAEKQRRRAEDTLGPQKVPPTPGEDGGGGKKRENDSGTPAAGGSLKKPLDPSLSSLIKSIKSKTEQFQARKKQKFM